MKIRIEWLSDSKDCETCGSSFAEGARVYRDGVLWIDRPAIVSCFDSKGHHPSEEIFAEILAGLGVALKQEGNEIRLPSGENLENAEGADFERKAEQVVPQEGKGEMKIRIEWLTASRDCQMCGGLFSEGARVYRDDALWIDRTPTADCKAPIDDCNASKSHYPSETIFTEILAGLGVELEQG